MVIVAPEYVRLMARYNAWQNRQMKAALGGLPAEALSEDRGAFFGSILGTLNHLLWGDGMWMARFDGGERPEGGIPDSVSLTPTFSEWAVARFRMDGRILRCAEALRAIDLAGELRWYSGAVGAEVAKPMAQCVTHMFNHQTHHRGQLHAMATAAGAKGWTTDIPFLPEDGSWL